MVNELELRRAIGRTLYWWVWQCDESENLGKGELIRVGLKISLRPSEFSETSRQIVLKGSFPNNRTPETLFFFQRTFFPLLRGAYGEFPVSKISLLTYHRIQPYFGQLSNLNLFLIFRHRYCFTFDSLPWSRPQILYLQRIPYLGSPHKVFIGLHRISTHFLP